MVHRVFPIFTLPVGATRLCCARAANLHTSAPGILQSHPHVFGVWVPTRYRPREVECGRLVSRRRRKTVMLHAPVSQPSALNAGGGLGPNPVVGRSASGCAHLDTCGRGGHVHGQGNAQADALRVQKSPTLRSQKPPEKSRGEGISGPKKAPGIRARNLAHSNMCPHKAVPFSGHGFRPRNSKTRGQFSCSGDGRGPPLYRAVQLLHRKPVIWPWPRPQLTPTTRPSPHPLLAAPVHASGPPRRLSETLPASSTHRPDTQGCHDVRDARSMAPGNMCVRVENVPRDTGMRRASHGRVHDLERGETTVNLSTNGVNNFSLRRASESARYCPRAQVMTTRSCNARRAHRPPCEPHSNRRCFKVFILEAPQQPNRSSSRCPAHGTKLYMPLPSAPF